MVVNTNKALASSFVSKKLPFRMLQSMRNLLDDMGGARGAIFQAYRGVDFQPSVGAVNYTAGTTATAYTVTIGGTAIGSVTGTAGNGLTTAQSVAAAINAQATLSRWVTATAVDTGSSTGQLVLTLKAFLPYAGDLGNQISLAATGVGATASAATFGSGTGGVAGTNAADSSYSY
jgi:hypothetical protein